MINQYGILIRVPSQHFRVDYDEEADVLYISFQHPQKATNTIMRDDGLLLRYRADQLVGVTVFRCLHPPLSPNT